MLLSIIIPVFNTENFLISCIDSIMGQITDDCEIIIIDDGSTDNSGNLCDDLSNRYDSITVVHQKNCGVSTARNKGLNLAKGKYVTFVDSDDILTENWISIITNYLVNKSPDMLTYSATYYMAEGKPVSKNINSFTANNRYEVYDKFPLIYTVGIGSVCFSAYNNELLKKFNIKFDTDKKLNEETYFNLKVFEVINSFLYLDDELYQYRVHSTSSSNKGSCELIDLIEAKVDYYNKFLARTNFNSPESPEEMLKKGVYLQFLQAVISTNQLTFKQRNGILERLFSDKIYYKLLLSCEELNNKGFNMLLCRISVKTKITIFITVPSTIKRYFVNKEII